MSKHYTEVEAAWLRAVVSGTVFKVLLSGYATESANAVFPTKKITIYLYSFVVFFSLL